MSANASGGAYHSAHPCASPYGQPKGCAKRLSCRFVAPAILATQQNVPVLPIYIQGANQILPPGTNRSQAAPVVARIGDLITFTADTSIGEAKHAMEQAIHALAGTTVVSHDQAAAS